MGRLSEAGWTFVGAKKIPAEPTPIREIYEAQRGQPLTYYLFARFLVSVKKAPLVSQGGSSLNSNPGRHAFGLRFSG